VALSQPRSRKDPGGASDGRDDHDNQEPCRQARAIRGQKDKGADEITEHGGEQQYCRQAQAVGPEHRPPPLDGQPSPSAQAAHDQADGFPSGGINLSRSGRVENGGQELFFVRVAIRGGIGVSSSRYCLSSPDDIKRPSPPTSSRLAVRSRCAWMSALDRCSLVGTSRHSLLRQREGRGALPRH